MMLPARYRSSDNNAVSRTGANVGKPRTMEVSNSPLTRAGRVQPTVLTIGLMAIRTG